MLDLTTSAFGRQLTSTLSRLASPPPPLLVRHCIWLQLVAVGGAGSSTALMSVAVTSIPTGVSTSSCSAIARAAVLPASSLAWSVGRFHTDLSQTHLSHLFQQLSLLILRPPFVWGPPWASDPWQNLLTWLVLLTRLLHVQVGSLPVRIRRNEHVEKGCDGGIVPRIADWSAA